MTTINDNLYKVVSKLEYKNINIGNYNSGITFNDDNKHTSTNWTITGPVSIQEENDKNVMFFSSNNSKIVSNYILYEDIKLSNIHIEFKILLPFVQNDQIFFNISNNTSSNFRIGIKNSYENGLTLSTSSQSISCNYKFDRDKIYHVIVTKFNDIYTFYINNELIGYCENSNFTSSINTTTNNLIVIGAKSSNTTSSGTDVFVGRIWDINIIYGIDAKLKYDYQPTKYGNNLLSKLNYGSLATVDEPNLYTTKLETVYNSNINWNYNEAGLTYKKLSNGYTELNGSIFSTIFEGNLFTLSFTMNNSINCNNIRLFNLNDEYYIRYSFVSSNEETEPDIEYIPNTSSAINFEDDLNDKSGVLWEISDNNLINTSKVIYGTKSYLNRSINDYLRTNNTIITPNNINKKFYFSFYIFILDYHESIENSASDIVIEYPLFSQCEDKSNGVQCLYIDKETKCLSFRRESGVTSDISGIGKTPILKNKRYKISGSYDTNVLRFYVNDELELYICDSVGWVNTTQPFYFLSYNRPSFRQYDNYTNGIIDNINFIDGYTNISNDKYKNNLVCDLDFDTTNNTITDNGYSGITWTNVNCSLTKNNFSNTYSSLVLDGGGDYLLSSSNEPFLLDQYISWAFEIYFNTSTTSKRQILFDRYNGNDGQYQFSVDSSGSIFFTYSNPYIAHMSIRKNLNDGVNHKLLITKKYNTVYIFIDDVLDSTVDVTNISFSGSASNSCIGVQYSSRNQSYDFNGYIHYFKFYDTYKEPENYIKNIHLPLSNNVLDSYNNSVWDNNGVTFTEDAILNEKCAVFNDTSVITSNQIIDFQINDFMISFNIYNEYINTLLFSSIDDVFKLYTDKLIINNTTYSFNDGVNCWSFIKLIKSKCTLYLFVNDSLVEAINLNSFYSNFLKISYIGNSFIGKLYNLKIDIIDNKINFTTPDINNTTYFDNDDLIIRYNQSNGVDNNSSLVMIFEDSPVVTDYIVEMDVFISKKAINRYIGLTFNTDSTIINSNNLTNITNGGYTFYLIDTKLRIWKGANSTSTTNSSELITTNSLDADLYFDDKYHTLKFVKNATNLKLYLDNTLFIDVNDSTHNNIASKIALINYEDNDMYLNSVKAIRMYDTSGNIIYNKTFKSINDKLLNIEKTPNIFLSLQSNNLTNLGTTNNLTFNPVGNHVYEKYKGLKFDVNTYLTINNPNDMFNYYVGGYFEFGCEFNITSKNSSTSATGYCVLISNGLSNSLEERFDIGIDSSTNKIYIKYKSTAIYELNYYIVELTWYRITFKIGKDKAILSLYDNEEKVDELVISNYNNNIIFSSGIYIGRNTNYTNTYMDGYIKNINISYHETNFDKIDEILKIDFSQSNDRYLISDETNKHIIKPVNIDTSNINFDNKKYSCYFNGVDQYLSLGKSNLLNFENDDFLIEIKFTPTETTNLYGCLISNGMIENTNKDCIIINSSGNIELYISNVNLETDQTKKVVYDELNTIIFYREGNQLNIKLNNDIIHQSEQSLNFNLNRNNNTFIGKNTWSELDGYYKGTINSIKVFRYNIDMSLLEYDDSNNSIYEKFDILKGEETIHSITYDNSSTRKINFISDYDKSVVSIGDDIFNIEKSELQHTNNIKLFSNYYGDVKEVKLYNDAIYENDTPIDNILVDAKLPELEYIEDEYEEIYIYQNGKDVIRGFVEGGNDRKFIIVHRYENYVIYEGVGSYEYYNFDINYIDDYEIYEIDSKQRYPLYKHEMKKGYISGAVNLANCGLKKGQKLKVYCYRNDTQRLIGVYELDDYNRYEIPNLDVNSKYDIIFKDESRKIENISSSYRTPKEY